ncbi:MAG: hypothetical protein ACTSP1_18090 [Candidatus Freyarchaeota archaeon]
MVVIGRRFGGPLEVAPRGAVCPVHPPAPRVAALSPLVRGGAPSRRGGSA